MEANVGTLANAGLRLRVERDRLRLNQEDFGRYGGVTRNSQQNYEAGKRPFDVNYLIALAGRGVDVLFILTGRRVTGSLDQERSQLLNAYDAMPAIDRFALMHVASSFSGQVAPALPLTLPSTEALEDAMSGLLEEGQDYSPAELVHEIATQLPIILQAAQHEIAAPASGSRDSEHERPAAPGGARPSARQGRRT